VADFNAGSIEGTLDLNRDPFTEGLDLAKNQAKEFTDQKLQVELSAQDTELKAQLKDLQAQLDELRGVTVEVDIDDAEAQAKLDELRASGLLRNEDIEIQVKVEDSEPLAKIELLKAEIDELKLKIDGINKTKIAPKIDDSGFTKFLKDAEAGESAMTALKLTALGLAPALIPIAGVLGSAGLLGIAALGSGFAQAAVGLGAFAVVAKSDYTDMTTAATALATAQAAVVNAKTTAQQEAALKGLAAAENALHGPIGAAATAYNNFEKAFAKVKSDTSGPVFGVLTAALNDAASLLPKIEPLIVAAAGGLQVAVGLLDKALAGPGFKEFLTMVSAEIGPDIIGFTKIIIGFAGGIGHLLEEVNPLLQIGIEKVTNIAGAFDKWAAASGKENPIEKLLGYISSNGPAVMHALEGLGTDLVKLVTALQPLAGPALKILTDFTGKGGLGGFLDLANIISPVLADLLGFRPVAHILAALVIPVTALVGLFKTYATVKKFAESMRALGAAVGIVDGETAGLAVSAGLAAIASTAMAVGVGLLDTAVGTLDILLAPFEAIFGIGLVAVGALIVVVAALGFGVYELVKHWSSVVKFFEKLWKDVYGFFKKYSGDILTAVEWFLLFPYEIYKNWGDISSWFSKIWDDVYSGVVSGVGEIASWLTGIWGKIYNDVKKWFGDIVTFVKTIPDKLVSLIKRAANGVLQGFEYMVAYTIAVLVVWPLKLVNAIKSLVTDIPGVAEKAWNGFINNTEDIASDIINFVEGLPKKILDGLETLGSLLLNAAKTGWDDFYNAMGVVHVAIVNFVKKLPGRIIDALETLASKLKLVATTAWNDFHSAIVTGVDSTVSFIAGLPEKAWNALLSLGGKLQSIGATAMSDLGNAINAGINGVLTFFEEIPSALLDSVEQLGTKLYDAGKAIIKMLASGIKAAAGDVGSAFTGVLGGIIKKIPHSPVEEGPLTALNNGYSGGMISKMLADGITKGAPATISAATELAKNVSLALEPKLSASKSLIPASNSAASAIAATVAAQISAANNGGNAPTVHVYLDGKEIIDKRVQVIVDKNTQALTAMLGN
jgi:phage-related protein